METGYKNYTCALLDIANKIYGKLDSYCEFMIISTIKTIAEGLDYVDDYKDFLDNIDLEMLCRDNRIDSYYLSCYITEYAKNHAAFKLNNAEVIPNDIKTMDFHGYSASINAKGFFRKVNFDYLRAVYITYAPYNGIKVLKNGEFRIEPISKYYKKIIFNNKTQEFISGYKTKNGYRYKPAQLKELFTAISICDTKEDEENAYGIIDFLCKKYGTYIFKDLYSDFLKSDGLLLPILITEASKYHTKHELFTKFYNMPIKGNWNKKNANLTYIILKLKNRMTEEAIARSMQCANAPKIKRVGKLRYIMTYILYEAIYNVPVGNFTGDGLLADALYEEYQNKKIKLLPEAQTVNEHNERHRQNTFKKADYKLKIKKNTKFKNLIANMPENFELIKTSKRIINEGNLQKNCVADYCDKINSDRCMIYSTEYEKSRHTIEIILKNGQFAVAQCFKSCNRAANPKLMKQLKDVLNEINRL